MKIKFLAALAVLTAASASAADTPNSPELIVTHIMGVNNYLEILGKGGDACPRTDDIITRTKAATDWIYGIDQELVMMRGGAIRDGSPGAQVRQLISQAAETVDKAMPTREDAAVISMCLRSSSRESPYAFEMATNWTMWVQLANLKRASIETRKDANVVGDKLISRGAADIKKSDLEGFSYAEEVAKLKSDFKFVSDALDAVPADAPEYFKHRVDVLKVNSEFMKPESGDYPIP